MVQAVTRWIVSLVLDQAHGFEVKRVSVHLVDVGKLLKFGDEVFEVAVTVETDSGPQTLSKKVALNEAWSTLRDWFRKTF